MSGSNESLVPKDASLDTVESFGKDCRPENVAFGTIFSAFDGIGDAWGGLARTVAFDVLGPALPPPAPASSSESTWITVVFSSTISQSSSSSLSSGLRLLIFSPIITKSDGFVNPIFFTSSTQRSCKVLNRPIPYVIR
uniref:Uncharacterized protein n=1 Tax=Anopheles atroparvus TaxID=41427 RepID=A0A182J247_ANOAO